MAREHLLLIDAKDESAAVMELALRQSGYSVARSADLKQALELIDESAPSLLVYDLTSCEDPQASLRLLASPQAGAPALPCIFLCEPDTREKIAESHRPSLGDCLMKPVYLRELVSRVNLLLESKRRAQLSKRDGGRSRFSGELSDLGVVDLLQTIDICKKSGVVSLKTRAGDGEIWFTHGALVDACFGKLQAEAAVYRMIRLDEGSFGVQFKSVRRAKAMSSTTQEVLLEGLSQLDKWQRYCEQLPGLDKPLVANPEFLKKEGQFSHASADAVALIRRFKKKKTIRQVLYEGRRNDLELLEMLSEVYFSGALLPAPEGRSRSMSGEIDLSGRDAGSSRPTEAANRRPVSTTEPLLHEEPAPRPRPKAITQRMTSRGGPVASSLPSPDPRPAINASSRSGRSRVAKTLVIPYAPAQDTVVSGELGDVGGASGRGRRPVSSTLVYHEVSDLQAQAPFTQVSATAAARKLDEDLGEELDEIPQAANSHPADLGDAAVKRVKAPVAIVPSEKPEPEPEAKQSDKNPVTPGQERREQMLAQLEDSSRASRRAKELDAESSSKQDEGESKSLDRRMWTDVSEDQELGSASMMGAVIGCLLTVAVVLGQPFIFSYLGLDAHHPSADAPLPPAPIQAAPEHANALAPVAEPQVEQEHDEEAASFPEPASFDQHAEPVEAAQDEQDSVQAAKAEEAPKNEAKEPQEPQDTKP